MTIQTTALGNAIVALRLNIAPSAEPHHRAGFRLGGSPVNLRYIQPLSAVSQWQWFHALPDDALFAVDLKHRHCAAGIAYEEVSPGQHLHACEPTDAKVRQIRGVQMPHILPGGIHFDDT